MTAAVLAAVLLRAQTEDRHVVAYLNGSVEWRKITAGSYGRWRDLAKGQVLEPMCEVRTGRNSDVWLQVGDLVDSTLTLPPSTRVVYWHLYAKSSIRINSRYLPGVKIIQPLKGRVYRLTIRGRLGEPR